MKDLESGSPRERAIADPLLQDFVQAFDAEVLEVEDLSEMAPKQTKDRMTPEDMPALKMRLEAQGWRVKQVRDELIGTPLSEKTGRNTGNGGKG